MLSYNIQRLSSDAEGTRDVVNIAIDHRLFQEQLGIFIVYISGST